MPELSPEINMFAAFGYCAFMLLLFLVFQKFPPKKINWYYGYRTRRTMTNEAIWKDANTYYLNITVKLFLYCFLVPALLYFIFPAWNFAITVGVNVLIIFASFFITEKYLDQVYDHNGNPKQL